MARKSMPKFKSEAEEADWYATPAGRRQGIREFERALKEGTIIREKDLTENVLRQLLQQAKERATQHISIRIPVADIERAKAVAKKKGLPYQSLLKQIIHEGLKKAG